MGGKVCLRCKGKCFALLKFIYSEKTTNFFEISTLLLTGTNYIGQKYGGDVAKTCGLLRTYELYLKQTFPPII